MYQYQYSQWDGRELPAEPRELVAMIQALRQQLPARSVTDGGKRPKSAPLLVHCRWVGAGHGRPEPFLLREVRDHSESLWRSRSLCQASPEASLLRQVRRNVTPGRGCRKAGATSPVGPRCLALRPQCPVSPP